MNSNSPAFSLNAIDWRKIRTGALVALAGAIVSYVPLFMGFTYVIPIGRSYVDVTPFVVCAFSVLANVLREYIADHQAIYSIARLRLVTDRR